MWRAALTAVLLLSLAATVGAQNAADGTKSAETTPRSPAEKKLLENPNDAQAISSYLNEVMTAVVRTMQSDPQSAREKLDAMEAFIEKLKVDQPAAKTRLSTLKLVAESYRNRIDAQSVPLAELEKKVLDNPDDVQAVSRYVTRLQMDVSPLARTQPDVAAQKIDEAKSVLKKVEETATNRSVKSQLANYNRSIESMTRIIESGKKLIEMIGKDAAPLKVESWVNGSPLTDADLKGKVVFLDFWAVWCGPCIATFPHLREWNEKYGDKGLVMIGLTQYYNYQWDEAAKRASRATEKVTHEEELAMLAKFAESYDLKHRFAIQADHSLSDYYGVTGIPHVVVIDQQGKIRLMKVGSGESNAKEIGDMLAQLLDPKASGGQ